MKISPMRTSGLSEFIDTVLLAPDVAKAFQTEEAVMKRSD
jgi:hypothetical protein